MVGACWIYLLTALTFSVAHNHHGVTETYHVSAGYLFLLKCPIADAHTNVTWSRAGNHSLSLPSGVEVWNGSLSFLPVQTSHNGTYTCEKRDETGSSEVTFRVLVSTEKCPDTPDTISIKHGVMESIPCKQPEIFRLNNSRNIHWMKDCQPMEPLSLDKRDGTMRLPSVSADDSGKYTCLVEISRNGRSYTAARSIQVTVHDGPLIKEPEVLFPQKEVVKVQVGMGVELKCLALPGTSLENHIFMYWVIEDTFADEYKELNESWTFVRDGGKLYGRSTLSIPTVRRQFLNIPIKCHVANAAGAKTGEVLLQEVDHAALFTIASLCITAPLVTLVLAAGFVFFRVDVVLAHRKLFTRFSKQVPDGKLYDGYVSFLLTDTLGSDEIANFALQILPEELEKKHGYTLFIRGRDDCPGEAAHDIIAAALHQSRRLIIILSPEIRSAIDCKTVETSPLYADQSHLAYEQEIGIYDALTQNDPRVILLEIGGPVDYSYLPQSLHYIRRKQGALKWKKVSPGSQKLISCFPV
uniref:Interleukin-1 receptor type 1-like n=1 Tax=Echeneis naucrates TaxID=173247 RepID=A0A665VQ67_ECHNA